MGEGGGGGGSGRWAVETECGRAEPLVEWSEEGSSGGGDARRGERERRHGGGQ
jgi:hypothetical protein